MSVHPSSYFPELYLQDLSGFFCFCFCFVKMFDYVSFFQIKPLVFLLPAPDHPASKYRIWSVVTDSHLLCCYVSPSMMAVIAHHLFRSSTRVICQSPINYLGIAKEQQHSTRFIRFYETSAIAVAFWVNRT